MYSTHSRFPNACESYISVGDPYEKKVAADDRRKGKQFMTCPSKRGPMSGCFGHIEYKDEPYVETKLYVKSQPLDERKLGFGTHDASKRDEFTTNIRTAQYRETLKRERLLEAKMRPSTVQHEPVEFEQKTEPESDCFLVPTRLFDVCHSNSPVCSKCTKDTFFCKHKAEGHKRRLGSMRSTALDIGFDASHVSKPQFGRHAVTKEFYDRSSLTPKDLWH